MFGEELTLFELDDYGHARACGCCGGPLALDARIDARYCSDACRARGWRKDRRSLWRVGGDG